MQRIFIETKGPMLRIQKLINTIKDIHPDFTVTIFEIGARPTGKKEPFSILPDRFPGSTILSIEIDPKECEELNRSAAPGYKYYPSAFGKTEESRTLYETVHPMCTSLYQPNDPLLDLYNNMEVAKLKTRSKIDTISLDSFVEKNGIGQIDFIKIDIQGAELDVFMGGLATLRNVMAIVSEVELIPLYYEQPLFGDVCSFLLEQNFMFHSFLSVAGRSLKPFILGGDPNRYSQQMWGDAIFFRNIRKMALMSSIQVLKLALMSSIYDIADVAAFCLAEYDRREKTALCASYLTQ
jgi:FkbM family methyltransferase